MIAPAGQLFAGVIADEPSAPPRGSTDEDRAPAFDSLLAKSDAAEGPESRSTALPVKTVRESAQDERVEAVEASDHEEEKLEGNEPNRTEAVREDDVVVTASIGSWQFAPLPTPILTQPSMPTESFASGEAAIDSERGAVAPVVIQSDAETISSGAKGAEEATAKPAEQSSVADQKTVPKGGNAPGVAAGPAEAAPQPGTAAAETAREPRKELPTADRGAEKPSPAKPHESKVLTLPADAQESPAVLSHGIPVAKEHRAMPTLLSQPVQQDPPAAFAATEESGSKAGQGSERAAEFAGNLLGESAAQLPHGHSGDMSFSGGGEFNLAPSLDQSAAPDTAARETTPVASNATEVIQHIERTIERLRAQERPRIEVHLPMQDGAEVIVKLRVEQGQVRAVFQTGSEGLRQALEHGWNQLSVGAGDRDLKIGPAVFEPSPSFSSGQQSSQQGASQQRDRRESDQSVLREVRLEDFLPGRNRGAQSAPSPVRVAANSNVQVYA